MKVCQLSINLEPCLFTKCACLGCVDFLRTSVIIVIKNMLLDDLIFGRNILYQFAIIPNFEPSFIEVHMSLIHVSEYPKSTDMNQKPQEELTTSSQITIFLSGIGFNIIVAFSDIIFYQYGSYIYKQSI